MNKKQIQALSDYEQACQDQIAGLISLDELKKIADEKKDIWIKEQESIVENKKIKDWKKIYLKAKNAVEECPFFEEISESQKDNLIALFMIGISKNNLVEFEFNFLEYAGVKLMIKELNKK